MRGPSQPSTPLYSQFTLRIYAATNGLGGGAWARETLGTPLTPPHLFLTYTHTYLCSATFVVNITHEHDNDRTLQAIYCYASYFVGLR